MKNYVLMVLALVFSSTLFAQNVSEFKVLSGESAVEVIFDYSELRLLKENYTEEEYIKRRTEDLNSKTLDSGDVWAKSWRHSKGELWEPKFLLLLNKYAPSTIKFSKNTSDSKYVLKVNVIWIYPGWDVGVMKQPSKVTSIVTLYERANPSKTVVSHEFKNMPGNQFGSNFSNESRLAESYAKTGKELGKILAKRVK